ncbi:MAG: hypothetical protein KGO03_07710 [Gemmatimonadota bacterium]|nr:hypothetical protein [Gemmatimonadota bacterium]
MRLAVLSGLLLAVSAFGASAGAQQPRAPQFRALDVQSGHWVYRGTTAPRRAGDKPGTFTWDEHCGWSADQLFLMCSFDNDWSGRKVQSLVVDTWNSRDKAYWHYEMFAVGASGEKPFASKMTIRGDTWLELGTEIRGGKTTYERISYVYSSPTHVTVKIEVSPDNEHWTTTLDGAGVKQSE